MNTAKRLGEAVIRQLLKTWIWTRPRCAVEVQVFAHRLDGEHSAKILSSYETPFVC